MIEQRQTAIKDRKERDKEQRRNEILTAANKLFIEKSFFKTTMDDIAINAGLSRPTIYQYFKTKDELYMSLMIPVINSINNRLQNIYDTVKVKKYSKGKDLISDLLQSFEEVLYEDPDLFITFMVSQETGVVRVLDEETRQKIIEKGRMGYVLGRMILSLSMEQKLLKKVNVYSLADLIWGMFWGVAQIGLIKSKDNEINQTLLSTLELAKKTIIDSYALKS